ncbi:hypothetical protein PACTADRAFT_40444 [Pachysolen tannophilus NRRL Y-2460]|uniref:Protein-S-isoprenylcysteine O-methyltransferase n=1 Tax=Pachysolen tannophilus NRRL Y-2460 TaxID=669874 RepID=A0A1E4TX16_PACTA|nr:hypothetical protein PACTADRAFT_40444 [Pachysolen tannophilus NRRL Y-2460]
MNGTKKSPLPKAVASIAENPLDIVSLTSAILGVIFGIATTTLFILNYKQISIYIMSLSLFHLLEYFVTAKYNAAKVNKDSFLINNGNTYIAAHTVAIAEAFLENFYFPGFKRKHFYISLIGFLLMAVGQFLRSLAMSTAGSSFSHNIAERKKDDHILVTHGIYSITRHPSYAGFYCWAIGSQLLLINPICLIAFAIILWYFFSDRIKYEEKLLIRFFGDDYIEYKTRTGTLIPFVP